MQKERFSRTALLMGDAGMERLADTRVIILGVGGVGSWCAEGLVRSGIGHLTIVDPDDISESNINRQLMATTRTVGEVKVDALKARLLEIDPEADIVAVRALYGQQTRDSFDLNAYDYVIDATDSLKDKIRLILDACDSRATFFCALGAALKVDPSRVRVAEFWDVKGCPLGYILRKKMRQAGTLPGRKFLCVYDDEVLENRGSVDLEKENEGLSYTKAAINGATAPVTAIFGMTLAGLVLKDIYNK